MPEEPIDPGSPRATVADYLSLCRSGRYGDAARYLDVPPSQAGRGAVLARKLKAVLDRHIWLDLEKLSPQLQGDTNDGVAVAYEVIAKIPRDSGQTDSVRLFRRMAEGMNPTWVVSRNTVEHIDTWYADLPQRWLLDHLPGWLLRSGPRELLVWQWVAFPCLFVLAWALGAFLGQITRATLARIARHSSSSWDELSLRRLRGPVTFAWALSLTYVALPLLGLYTPAEAWVERLLRGGYYFTFFWGLSRLIDAWGRVVGDSSWAKERASAKALVPIAVRLAKVLLIVVAVVFLFSAMGYPAGSIVAGLGVGGLAVALAAQKTVENLFGAFTLGADQPFRVGDLVKVEDFLGHVESIGLRSTRIRTLERSLVTIPNGRLSEMRIESFAARDRIRFACNLVLAHGTTAEQLREVLAAWQEVLRKSPKVWPDGIVVHLKELGELGMVVEVQAWFQTVDFAEFQQIREATLLSFLTAIDTAKAYLATSTRTNCPVADSSLARIRSI